MSESLRLATRSSPLAMCQARIVKRMLEHAAGSAELEVSLVAVSSAGDQRQDVPLHEIGGRGIFTTEVDRAVAEGRADAAVHSAKDLPASLAFGSADAGVSLPIVAVPERADPRDALVGARLASLAPGATVATGSVRRRAQISWLRPDLCFEGVRGNMATRLAKVPPGGALVVAMAALERLGRAGEAAEVFSVTELLPQVGQGAIAVTARPDDDESAALLAPIDDPDAHRALEAERAFLARLGGGCDLPVGAYASLRSGGAGGAGGAGGSGGAGASMLLEAMIARLDGHGLLRRSCDIPSGADPVAAGRALADELLDESGGRELLGTFAMREPS